MFSLNATFEKSQGKKKENESVISYSEFKQSVRKSDSHQDLVLLTADRKDRKKHSSNFICYHKSGWLLSALSFLCLFYTYNESCPAQVIIDVKIYSKSHDKANTCLHWCLERRGGAGRVQRWWQNEQISGQEPEQLVAAVCAGNRLHDLGQVIYFGAHHSFLWGNEVAQIDPAAVKTNLEPKILG